MSTRRPPSSPPKSAKPLDNDPKTEPAGSMPADPDDSSSRPTDSDPPDAGPGLSVLADAQELARRIAQRSPEELYGEDERSSSRSATRGDDPPPALSSTGTRAK